jgi:hypothetical protein
MRRSDPYTAEAAAISNDHLVGMTRLKDVRSAAGLLKET